MQTVSKPQTLVTGVPSELSLYWQQYPYSFGQIFCRVRSFLSERFIYSR